jgi:hypothetical protein
MTRARLLGLLLTATSLAALGCRDGSGWVHQPLYEGKGLRVELPPDLFPLHRNFEKFEAVASPEWAEMARSLRDTRTFVSRDFITSVRFNGMRYEGVCANIERGLELVGERRRDVELSSGRWMVRWERDISSVDVYRCVDDEMWNISAFVQSAPIARAHAIARTLAESAELRTPPAVGPRPVDQAPRDP